jgi:hypothetical protein
MKASIIAVLLLASATLLLNVEASLAQELSAEDRACVNAAIDRLPLVDALRVEGSRVLMSQPGHQGRGKQYPYNAMVEIDVSVAGVRTTHNFFCHGDTILMKALPVGMR